MDNPVAVERHFYRCESCGIGSHVPGEQAGERELDCSICLETTLGEFIRSRTVVIEKHLVDDTDRIDGSHFSGGDAAALDYIPEGHRDCPACLKSRLCSIWEAKRVFRTSGWGATSMMDDADKVCSYCHVVRIDGQWQRMETVDSRAYKLAQASSGKDENDYREILTRGIDVGKKKERKPSVENAEGW